MSDGLKRDPKDIMIIINNITIPTHLYDGDIEIQPESEKWVIKAGNAGGHEKQRQHNVDGGIKFKLFVRDEFFQLEEIYNNDTAVSVLVKDLNSNRSYFDNDTVIKNIGSYKLGMAEGADIDIPMPGLKFTAV